MDTLNYGYFGSLYYYFQVDRFRCRRLVRQLKNRGCSFKYLNVSYYAAWKGGLHVIIVKRIPFFFKFPWWHLRKILHTKERDASAPPSPLSARDSVCLHFTE